MILKYVAYDEIQKHKDLSDLANIHKINTLYMIKNAGSGHLGTSFSSAEIMTYIYYKLLSNDDIFFSSKGHDVCMQYAILQGLGKIPFDTIKFFRRGGCLPGHPDINYTPQLVTNTGSLGMGLSKAKGMAIVNRINGIASNIYVLMGDGEMEEGQNWEAIRNIAKENLSCITAIIDFNGWSSDVKTRYSVKELTAQFNAFGWETTLIPDGNSIDMLHNYWPKPCSKPRAIICMPTKGINGSQYHSGPITDEQYTLALDTLNHNLLSDINFTETVFEMKMSSHIYRKNNLVESYSRSIDLLMQYNNVICLSADLIKDCGLDNVQKTYPNRLIECGISEQDMVSTAGGIALSGKIPVCHSFACFLASRANEQIYNNCTERKKIIYVGFMAGILHFGPGVSHESRRDIDLLRGMPNLTIMEPRNSCDLIEAVIWAYFENAHSTYIRICQWPDIENMIKI